MFGSNVYTKGQTVSRGEHPAGLQPDKIIMSSLRTTSLYGHRLQVFAFDEQKFFSSSHFVPDFLRCGVWACPDSNWSLPVREL